VAAFSDENLLLILTVDDTQIVALHCEVYRDFYMSTSRRAYFENIKDCNVATLRACDVKISTATTTIDDSNFSSPLFSHFVRDEDSDDDDQCYCDGSSHATDSSSSTDLSLFLDADDDDDDDDAMTI
jgi:hypothetical protein